MENIILDVQTRDTKVKARNLCSKRLIPAEYYGKGVKNQSFSMDYESFRKVFKSAGSNTIIILKIDGKNELNVLVHDVQYDPITDHIRHVDFSNVRMDEEVKTKVQIIFNGIAPAVKELGGILMTPVDEIEIKCLPKDLIHKIDVNIDVLVDYNSFIRVKDLIIPKTITVLTDPNDIVATVVPPKEEKEEEVVAKPAEGEAAAAAEAAEGAVPAEGEAKEAQEPKEEQKKDSKK